MTGDKRRPTRARSPARTAAGFDSLRPYGVLVQKNALSLGGFLPHALGSATTNRRQTGGLHSRPPALEDARVAAPGAARRMGHLAAGAGHLAGAMDPRGHDAAVARVDDREVAQGALHLPGVALDLPFARVVEATPHAACAIEQVRRRRELEQEALERVDLVLGGEGAVALVELRVVEHGLGGVQGAHEGERRVPRDGHEDPSQRRRFLGGHAGEHLLERAGALHALEVGPQREDRAAGDLTHGGDGKALRGGHGARPPKGATRVSRLTLANGPYGPQ